MIIKVIVKCLSIEGPVTSHQEALLVLHFVQCYRTILLPGKVVKLALGAIVSSLLLSLGTKGKSKGKGHKGKHPNEGRSGKDKTCKDNASEASLFEQPPQSPSTGTI